MNKFRLPNLTPSFPFGKILAGKQPSEYLIPSLIVWTKVGVYVLQPNTLSYFLLHQ